MSRACSTPASRSSNARASPRGRSVGGERLGCRRRVCRAADRVCRACATKFAFEKHPPITSRPPAPARRTPSRSRRAKIMTDTKYTIRGETGDWEVVVGLEVHAQVTSNAKLFSGAARRLARSPTRRCRWSMRRCPGCCPCPTANASDRRCAPAWRSRRRSTAGRGSTARTISMPICRRAIRFRSSTTPSWARAQIEIELDEKTRTRRQEHRRRAHPRRAGCGQVDARSASDHVLCRSEPLGRCADGNRVEAGHDVACRGRSLSAQAALDPALCRIVRRQYGARLHAR